MPTDINALRQRVRDRAQHRSPWCEIRNEGTRAVVRIYDVIDSWGAPLGVSANDVADQITGLQVDEIEVWINSPGGEVFDGVAIYNALRMHPARVVTRVDGLAASIASVIVQAGDERVMVSGSQMMVHNASGICFGDANEMLAFAEVLEHQNQVIAGIYAERAGADAAGFLASMAAETWMTADEAVEAGLADRVHRPAGGGDQPENNAVRPFSTVPATDAAAPAAVTVEDEAAAVLARARLALLDI